MYYSINILLDELSEFACTVFCREEGRRFARVALLPASPETADEETLYVGDLERALVLRSQGAAGFMLCPGDRQTERDERLLTDLILVHEDIRPDELYTKVQGSFMRLNEWIESMRETLLRGGSFQELLDLSEDTIGNTINISDSALTLLACTRGIATDDEISLLLRRYGYHPETSMARFRDGKSFLRWQATDDSVRVHPADEERKYTSLLRVFHQAGNAGFTHVIMICDHRAYTPALYEKFCILTENLAFCVRQRETSPGRDSGLLGDLISGIISGTLRGPEDIRARAVEAGLPLESNFQILTVTIPDGTSIVAGRMEKELKELFPQARVVRHPDELLLLFFTARGDLKELSALLAKYDARGGSSLPFRRIEALEEAYRQANLAARYGPVLRENRFVENAVSQRSLRISEYRKGLAFYLLRDTPENREIWKESFYGKMVLSLHEADVLTGTERLKVLSCYLLCSGHTTEASAMLHMNRNNIAYHVTRIGEQFGLDLSDPCERLNLLISCCMFWLYGP